MITRPLTENRIRALPPAAPGKRTKVPDGAVPGLILLVTENGAKSFALWRTWAGARNPSALTLGRWPALSLQAARAEARRLLALREQGIDPRAHRKDKEAAEATRRAYTFGDVLET